MPPVNDTDSLSPAIVELRHEHAEVMVLLRQAPAEEIIDHLREGVIDLAVVASTGRTRGLVTVPLTRERMVVLASPHRDLSASPVTLSALSDHPFVDFVPGWAVRQEVDRAFRAAGVDRQGAFETNDILAAGELVRADLGLTIVPTSLAALFPDLRSVAIARHAPTFAVGVVHRRDMVSPAATALLQHLQRSAPRSR